MANRSVRSDAMRKLYYARLFWRNKIMRNFESDQITQGWINEHNQIHLLYRYMKTGD